MRTPKFKCGDYVSFELMTDNKIYTVNGSIYVVDARGTFFQREEPSYDIMSKTIDSENDCLYKHIRESRCTKSNDKSCSITKHDII